jgi:AraC-like DNA-binding protein
MRLIPGQSHSLRLLVDYLRRLVSRQDAISAEFYRAISTHILDLIALRLRRPKAAAYARRDCTRSRRISRATSIKMDLSIAAVAAPRGHAAPSPQAIRNGGRNFLGICACLLSRFAYRLLIDHRLVARSVTSIAFDAGFSGPSHFNRMLGRRYNATPTEVRVAESACLTRSFRRLKAPNFNNLSYYDSVAVFGMFSP